MSCLKIIVIAFLLITGPVILESCCLGGGSCGCGDSKVPNYDINGVGMIAFTYPGMVAFPKPQRFAGPETLSGIQFAVILDISYHSELTGSYGSALFACSLPPPRCNDPIAAIEITSNAPLETLSGNAPAGSNLNSIFEAYNVGPKGRPVEELIGDEYLEFSTYIRSKEMLSKPQTHLFTITINLSDGREFVLVTPELELY